MKQLPPNCELECVDHDEDAWRMIFWGDDPYYSEVFHSGPGSVRDAAEEYCEAFGWDIHWPNKAEDTDELISELESLAEETISLIESHPEVFGASFSDHFENAPEGDFKWGDGDEMGDGVPSLDDDRWVHTSYGMEIERRNGVECIRFTEDDDCEEYEGGSTCFRYRTAMNNCFYIGAKQSLYNLYCARTGDDPLGNIMPQQETLDGVYRLTVTPNGIASAHVSGDCDERLDDFAITYIGGDRRNWDELQEVLEEGKTGGTDPDRDFSLFGSWTKWSVDESNDKQCCVTLHIKRRVPVVSQTTHIRETSFRGEDANVRKSHRYVIDEIAKAEAVK
jgi:hypothetical protein